MNNTWRGSNRALFHYPVLGRLRTGNDCPRTRAHESLFVKEQAAAKEKSQPSEAAL